MSTSASLPSPVFAGGLQLRQAPSGSTCVWVGTLLALEPPSQVLPLWFLAPRMKKELLHLTAMIPLPGLMLGTLQDTCALLTVFRPLCSCVLLLLSVPLASIHLRCIKNSLCVRQLCWIPELQRCYHVAQGLLELPKTHSLVHHGDRYYTIPKIDSRSTYFS